MEWWRSPVKRRPLRPSLPRCHQFSDVLRGNLTLVPILITRMPRHNLRETRLLTLSTSSFIRARDGRMLVESTKMGLVCRLYWGVAQGPLSDDMVDALRMFLRSGFEESVHGRTKERGATTRKNARESLRVYRNVIRIERRP